MGPLARLHARFEPSGRLSPALRRTGVRWWIRNGLGAQAMDTLSVGAFVTAFALELGASNIVIGLLAAIPHLTQVLQIAGVYIDDRWRNRRVISLVFTSLSRPMYLLMAACAFIDPSSAALTLFAIAYTLRYALTAFMSCSWNAWVRDLVPEARRGWLTGRRLSMMSLLAVLLGLGAAGFVDAWRAFALGPVPVAYSVLFVAAFLGGAFSTWCMTHMTEPAVTAPSADVALLHRLGHPWRDTNYRRLLLFIATWNFAVNLAAPFFMVHMLKRLALELWLVMALTLTSQLVNVLVLRRWGDIADRMSNKSVLQVCAPLFIVCIFAWTFTTFPERHVLTVPMLVVIHVFMGVAIAGVTLASGNIAMKLAPRGEATAYLANNSLVVSLASGVAPVVGGLLAHFFTERELSLSLHWRAPQGELEFDTLSISQWDFFFVFAALVGLVAVSFLARVREVGAVHEKLVLNEMYLSAKRFVQNLSSIAGLQQAGEFPFGKVRVRNGRRRARTKTTGTDARSDA
ncbi:MAG: MFS transporter [Gammaproteobacteria bacterium]|nr:MFS transporter [Gammaproteobacteria bacterium]